MKKLFACLLLSGLVCSSSKAQFFGGHTDQPFLSFSLGGSAGGGNSLCETNANLLLPPLYVLQDYMVTNTLGQSRLPAGFYAGISFRPMYDITITKVGRILEGRGPESGTLYYLVNLETDEILGFDYGTTSDDTYYYYVDVSDVTITAGTEYGIVIYEEGSPHSYITNSVLPNDQPGIDITGVITGNTTAGLYQTNLIDFTVNFVYNFTNCVTITCLTNFAYDTFELYTNDTQLDTLTGGCNFEAAYVARPNGVPPVMMGYDTMQDYLANVAVDGLNEGIGFTSPYVDRNNGVPPIMMGFDTMEAYSNYAWVNGLNRGNGFSQPYVCNEDAPTIPWYPELVSGLAHRWVAKDAGTLFNIWNDRINPICSLTNSTAQTRTNDYVTFDANGRLWFKPEVSFDPAYDSLLIVFSHNQNGQPYTGEILSGTNGQMHVNVLNDGMLRFNTIEVGTKAINTVIDYFYVANGPDGQYKHYTNGIYVSSVGGNGIAKGLGQLAAWDRFKGKIYEILIWTNTALSSSSISNLHYYSTNAYSYTP